MYYVNLKQILNKFTIVIGLPYLLTHAYAKNNVSLISLRLLFCMCFVDSDITVHRTLRFSLAHEARATEPKKTKKKGQRQKQQ